MRTPNYLAAGLITALLIGILSTSGCVSVSVPSGTTGNGGAATGNGGTTGNGLPLVDLTSTTESVARYPGSVMLSHYTMALPEGAYIYIAYGTAASHDTVEAWYRDMLEGSGWEFTMEVSTEDGKIITYVKEDTQENVSITLGSEDGYTTILVTYMDIE